MTAWRWKAIGAALVCFAAAGVNGWLAGGEMAHLLHGLAVRGPVITSAHYSSTGLILTPMGVSLGLIFLFSKQATPEEMKNASKRQIKGSGLYLAFVFASLLAAMLAPLPQYEIVNGIALGRGYVACPRPDWPRHQPDRWARPGPHGGTELCPGRGADPNL